MEDKELLKAVFLAEWALSYEGVGLDYSGIEPTEAESEAFFVAQRRGAELWLEENQDHEDADLVRKSIADEA